MKAYPKEIRFRRYNTLDNTGEYWAAVDGEGRPDAAVSMLLDSMGHHADTDGWDEPASPPGFYEVESLGTIVFDCHAHGIRVVFDSVPTAYEDDPTD